MNGCPPTVFRVALLLPAIGDIMAKKVKKQSKLGAAKTIVKENIKIAKLKLKIKELQRTNKAMKKMRKGEDAEG